METFYEVVVDLDCSSKFFHYKENAVDFLWGYYLEHNAKDLVEARKAWEQLSTSNEIDDCGAVFACEFSD